MTENKSVPELRHWSLAILCTVLPAAIDLNKLRPVMIVGLMALWGWNSDTKIFCPGNKVYTSSFLVWLKHKEGLNSTLIVDVSIMLQIPYLKEWNIAKLL